MTILAASATFAGASPASAQVPGGCNANRLSLDLIRDKTLVKNGDTINYYVEIENVGAAACNVSAVTARLQFPSPTGVPSGTFRTVVAGAAYPAGPGVARFGPFAYTVLANPGVARLEARVSIENGQLHDTPVASLFNADKRIGTLIPSPDIEVDKVANIKSGLAPQRVTYTFSVYNRTTPPLALSNVTLTDDQCPGVTRPVPNGDSDGDNQLDPAEVWLYTCTMDHGVGVFTNTAEACGELFLNGGPMPKVCDEDQETVEFTSPPPAAPGPPAPPVAQVPQVAVKPTTAAQAPCTLSTPKGLRVRAGQLNTIRVRVRNVDAGSKVTLTLPGTKKKYTAKTNASGIATLKVRPKKSGRAKLTVAQCSEVENLQVRPARRVVAQRNPRVTG